MIDRQVYDWGVALTTRPFAGLEPPLGALTIRSEITKPRPKRGSIVKISFTGVAGSNPLKLVEAQTWASAMNAIVMETQKEISEMKEGDEGKSRKRSK
jgi:hypothetical protein